MSAEITQRKHRREPLELQLTAMIDIFSMIVIFLIFGTVFGASEMVFPSSIKIPKSVSKESAESAPRLVIEKEMVTFGHASGGEEKYPLAWFKGQDPALEGNLAQVKAQLKGFVDQIPADSKKSGVLLNVIADKDTPYEDVFDVIKAFREAGFQSLLFVALGEPGAKVDATSPQNAAPAAGGASQ